MWNGMGNLV